MNTLLLFFALLGLAPLQAASANPFLEVAGAEPATAQFRGSEWGDHIRAEQLPLTARVVTSRIATLPWGVVYRIGFTDVVSRARPIRELPPLLFVVTDRQIVLLNEEHPEAEIKRLAALPKPPDFDPSLVRGIASGKFAHDDGPWETTITVKGTECLYRSSHGSGHYTSMTWRKGTGLVSYATSYGAHADGFSLQLDAPAVPQKKR